MKDWIKENILDKGIENVRFFAQMEQIETILPWGMAMVSSNNRTWVECRIDESRYKVADGYKITLVPLDKRFTYNHYYQSDFVSLIEDGYIILKTSDTDRIEHIKWVEPITDNVMMIHEADIVITA